MEGCTKGRQQRCNPSGGPTAAGPRPPPVFPVEKGRLFLEVSGVRGSGGRSGYRSIRHTGFCLFIRANLRRVDGGVRGVFSNRNRGAAPADGGGWGVGSAEPGEDAPGHGTHKEAGVGRTSSGYSAPTPAFPKVAADRFGFPTGGGSGVGGGGGLQDTR